MAWQEQNDGKKEPVSVAFEPRGERDVGFIVGKHDQMRPLFIDPTMTWNTFLGGNEYDGSRCIALDVNGNVYVTGYSYATWGTPIHSFTSKYDAFVAKLDVTGNLIWNTFLGGSEDDYGLGIALDVNGNVFVTGYSKTTWGSPVRPFDSKHDAFVAKLDTNGNLLWNTFLGGSEYDNGQKIAVDGVGNAYVTGYSDATWSSPIRPFTPINPLGQNDTFIARLDANGNLIWNTFLGGNGNDFGNGIGLDGSGNIICLWR